MLIIGLACFGKILHLKIARGQLYKGNREYCLDTTLPDSLQQMEPRYNDSTCNCFVVENAIKPRRGEIFDANGKILAGNSCIYGFTINGSLLNIEKAKKSKKRNPINDSLRINASKAISLTDVTNINQEIHNLAVAFHKQLSNRFPQKVSYYEERLKKAILEHKRIYILGSLVENPARQITAADIKYFRSLPIINYLQTSNSVRLLEIDSTFIRIYPYNELAKRTIGAETTEMGSGYGLEKTFNAVLQGTFGSKKMLEINSIGLPLDDRTEATDGLTIHTTIDLDMQEIVYECLMEKLIQLEATWGCAVLMETETGAIKAISNLSIKRQKDSSLFYTEQLNYAFRSTVEPGSTFKLASLLACLDKDSQLESRKYYLCKCSLKNKKINATFVDCNDMDKVGKKHRFASPCEIFQRSSNEGITGMVFSCFNDNYKNYITALDSMHITLPMHTQLEQVVPSIRRKARDNTSFYTLCFGGGINLAPIHTLTYFNAVANNGKMVAPMFVKYYSNDKDTVETLEPIVIKTQIAKPKSIKIAQNYLRQVVAGEYGTARKFRNNKVAFAGKTGTRDTYNDITKTYKANSNNISFCGYFPFDKPKYSCIIFIYEAGDKSSAEAVEVFANIANRISNLDTRNNFAEYKPVKELHSPLFTKVNSGDANTILNFMPVSNKIKTTSPQSYITLTNAKEETENLDFTKSFLPEKLIGMNPSDAIYELKKMGFNVKIQGFGKVQKVIKKSKSEYLLILQPG